MKSSLLKKKINNILITFLLNSNNCFLLEKKQKDQKVFFKKQLKFTSLNTIISFSNRLKYPLGFKAFFTFSSIYNYYINKISKHIYFIYFKNFFLVQKLFLFQKFDLLKIYFCFKPILFLFTCLTNTKNMKSIELI